MVTCQGESFFNVFQQPLDPKMSPQQYLTICAARKRRSSSSKHLLERREHPASLMTLLEHSTWVGDTAYSNFAEHCHTAHMFLTEVLSRKATKLEDSVSSLEGKDNVHTDPVHDEFKGGNLKMDIGQIDFVAGSRPPLASCGKYEAFPSIPTEVRSHSLDFETVDSTSEIEAKLVQRSLK